MGNDKDLHGRHEDGGEGEWRWGVAPCRIKPLTGVVGKAAGEEKGEER